jgi:hypothetical protein
MKKLILILCFGLVGCGDGDVAISDQNNFCSPAVQPYVDELTAAGLIIDINVVHVVADYIPDAYGALAFTPSNVILYHPDWLSDPHETRVLRVCHELAHLICRKSDATDGTILDWDSLEYKKLSWYVQYINDGCPPDVSWQ